MEFATIHRLRCPGVPNATCVVVRCRFFKRCGLIAVPEKILQGCRPGTQATPVKVFMS